MPGAGDAFVLSNDSTGDGTGARTARAADDVIGALQTSSLITATANQVAQKWGHRRFVSAPLAAHTFSGADGNWTFSYARSESNTNHNGQLFCEISIWRPSSGGSIGAIRFVQGTLMASTSEVADSVSIAGSAAISMLDGDILVFEVYDSFTQGMSVAYTSSFFYDGTTEASTTSCASFVTPPSALTLFSASTTNAPIRVAEQAVNRSNVY